MATLLIDSGSPAWVTVVAAAVTGLLGLGAGASAAALIGARQQTIEVFRNRMIEAADQCVSRLTAVSSAASVAQRRLDDREPAAEAVKPLADAAWFRGELEPHLGRLYVVFPDPRAADLANRFANEIEKWINVLERASRSEDSERQTMVETAHRHGDAARAVRDALLREMNRQIRAEGKMLPFPRRRS
jgi:hypothetical protein